LVSGAAAKVPPRKRVTNIVAAFLDKAEPSWKSYEKFILMEVEGMKCMDIRYHVAEERENEYGASTILDNVSVLD
jgi:hypothetical protein